MEENTNAFFLDDDAEEAWEVRRGVNVTLEPYEMDLAEFVGRSRFEEARRECRSNAYGYDSPDPVRTDIEAAAAEMAFAKAMNYYWGGSVNTFKDADVAGGWQVRHTPREDGCLIVRDRDHAEDSYALVVGQPPTLRIVGWIRGGAAKKAWRLRSPNNRPAAYFVEQTSLWPLSMLNCRRE